MREIGVTFQELDANDRETLRDLLSYSFILTREQINDWISDDYPLDWILAGYAGKRLVTSTAILPLEMQGQGRREWLGGISGVATDPCYRGKGLARDLMRESLDRMRARGWKWAVLYPFDYEFYHRLGWGQGATAARLTLEPRHLPSACGQGEEGEYRLVSTEEWSLLDRIHRVWVQRGPGALVREERTWRQLFSRPDRRREALVWESPGDQGAGYVIYDLQRREVDARLEASLLVIDWAWESPEARAALLTYLVRHHGQVGSMHMKVSHDDPLTNVEGNGVTKRSIRGPMVRIVDLGGFLERPPSYDGERITLLVEDALCPWNNGLFWLAPGEAQLMGGPCESGEPDLHIGIGALSSILWGSLSVETALSCGLVSGPRQDRLGLLSPLLPMSAPFFLDWF